MTMATAVNWTSIALALGADLPAGIALEQTVVAALATLPTGPRKLTDYAVAFKIPPESPLYQLLALIETVEAQLKPPA